MRQLDFRLIAYSIMEFPYLKFPYSRIPYALWPARMYEVDRIPPFPREANRLLGHDAPLVRRG